MDRDPLLLSVLTTHCILHFSFSFCFERRELPDFGELFFSCFFVLTVILCFCSLPDNDDKHHGRHLGRFLPVKINV